MDYQDWLVVRIRKLVFPWAETEARRRHCDWSRVVSRYRYRGLAGED